MSPAENSGFGPGGGGSAPGRSQGKHLSEGGAGGGGRGSPWAEPRQIAYVSASGSLPGVGVAARWPLPSEA